MHKTPLRAVLLAALFTTVALAGCADGTDDDPTPTDEAVDKDAFELESGKGAIAGLLVDDRFRPIDLEADAATDFQAEGFVLLQETGEQVQTTENGEFTFVDLDPGQYTLRVTASGHETTPTTVAVTEGVFAEKTVIARRVTSEGSSIITQEQSMFTECSFESPVVSSAWLPCTADLSLDGARTDFQSNFSAYEDQITAIVTEATFNQPGYYDIAVRLLDETSGGLGATYFAECSTDEPYLKFVLYPGEVSECGDRNIEFSVAQEFQTIMFAWSDTHGPAQDTAGENGVGVKFAVEAKVLQSVFLGEPEVDVDAYCQLCT